MQQSFDSTILVLVGLSAFGVTYLSMPSVKMLARQMRWVDVPGPRRLHSSPTPCNGGLAIWFGLLAGALVAAVVLSARITGWNLMTLVAAVSGALVMTVVGFGDDAWHFGWRAKVVAQVVATLPILFVVDVSLLAPLAADSLFVRLLGSAVLMGWMVLIMNAYNLVDGMDGVCAGVAVISLLGFVVLGGFDPAVLLLVTSLIGALLAFLRFNLPRASIFMGDMGSVAVGYLVAFASTVSLQAQPDVNRLLALIAIVGLPILDVFVSVFRRAFMGASLFEADRDHIHHRMARLQRGVVRQALVRLYFVAVVLVVAGVVIDKSSLPVGALVFFAVLVAGAFFLRALRYFERGSYGDAETTQIQEGTETRPTAYLNPRTTD